MVATLVGCTPSDRCPPQFDVEQLGNSTAIPGRYCFRYSNCGPLTLVHAVGGQGRLEGGSFGQLWAGLVSPDHRHVTVIWRHCRSLNRIQVHETDFAVGFVVSVSDCDMSPAGSPQADRWYGATVRLRQPLGTRDLKNDGPPSYGCD